jgi:hypothetical protein
MALGGWTLARTFELSTTQAVIDDKVDKLERHAEKLQTQVDAMKDLDEEIMDQHEDFIKALEGNDKKYNY